MDAAVAQAHLYCYLLTEFYSTVTLLARFLG